MDIVLVLVAFVVVGVVGLFLYLTGAVLWAGRLSPSGDKIEGEDPEPVEFRHIQPGSVVGDDSHAKRAARDAEAAARRERQHGAVG
jgi:hypothetical protein